MEIRVSAAGGLPELVADRGRLLQVLSNLVINVFQHAAGAARVELSAEQQGGEILISVSDNGAGVSAEHLSHIFERLYRTNQARTRAAGGSGLGLAIVRDLVEAQGGTITAENVPDGGFRITLAFPIVRSADPP